MKITRTLALAIGFAALAACGDAAEDNAAENMDANMTMPADNMTVDANNVTVVDNADMNMGNMDMNADMNAGNDATANTTNSY